MAVATINDTTLFYEPIGDGPTCLIMHGGLGIDHHLYRSLDPLCSHTKMVYYDHRCNGQSGRPPIESLDMGQLADDAAALIAHLGLGKSVIFGHSYGGFVAQEFAIRHPEQVAALILCDTSPGELGRNETVEEASGPPPPPEFLEMLASLPQTDEELSSAMETLFPLYLHKAQSANFSSAMGGTIFSAEAISRSFEVLSSWSAVDRLPSIKARTLLLVGKHDTFTSPSQTYRIARQLPHAELVEFDESGHMPWLDEPEKFFRVVGDWLQELELQTS